MPARAAFAALVVAGVGLAAARLDPLAGFICGGLLFASVGEALLPTTHRLDEQGVAVSRLLHHRQVPWDALAGWRATAQGFLLLGRGKLAFRARRRTVLLRSPPQPEVVEAWLRDRLGAPIADGPAQVAA